MPAERPSKQAGRALRSNSASVRQPLHRLQGGLSCCMPACMRAAPHLLQYPGQLLAGAVSVPPANGCGHGDRRLHQVRRLCRIGRAGRCTTSGQVGCMHSANLQQAGHAPHFAALPSFRTPCRRPPAPTHWLLAGWAAWRRVRPTARAQRRTETHLESPPPSKNRAPAATARAAARRCRLTPRSRPAAPASKPAC